jgi:hypothetical protein
MSTLKVNALRHNSASSDGVTLNSDGTAVMQVDGGMNFRNRIINGDMRIDQRNAGAAVNGIGSSIFAVDRWAYFTNATAGAFNAGQNLNSATPPAGFTKYLGFQVASTQTPTTTNAYFFGHKIEGFNVADLGWGAAGAKTITISFWVRSSVTGTHSGNVQNVSNARSYIFSYTISSANTWEQKSVTIAGDTSGTWPTDNTAGLILFFNLGCGTGIQTTAGSWNAAQYIGVTGGVSVVSNASATFYVTGVQLEVGSVATPFERRPYGTELALCQRYFQIFKGSGTTMARFSVGQAWSSTNTANHNVSFIVSMRAAPTLTQSGLRMYSPNIGDKTATVVIGSNPNENGTEMITNSSTGLVGGNMWWITGTDTSSFAAFSSEL